MARSSSVGVTDDDGVIQALKARWEGEAVVKVGTDESDYGEIQGNGHREMEVKSARLGIS